MHISKIDIEGYKTFSDKFSINISKGLCVILGENACGKSTIIDAIRLILQEDEYGQSGIVASDFHRPFSQDSVASEKILIQCEFSGLNSLQQTAYLPWLRSNDVSSALLSLQVENKLNRRGYYKREIWCGESTASVFEKDLLDRINCVYLPPLRDAEQRLKAIKGSRLARLFRNLNKQDIDSGTVLPLEKKVREFNRSLAIDESAGIVEVNELIKTQLRKALGTIYGQDTTIQFSESSFLRIVEHLRVLYYPTIPMSDKNAVSQFRDLSENSLGYNNLIYLATILAEFEGLSDSSDQDLKVLLIEEPEAHLHPQLQQRLMSYFAHVTDSNDRMQVIVTTHSPTIASHVNLDVISIVKRDSVAKNPLSVSLKDCITDTKSKQYLRRWLDITKSTLFFSKGVILVEGISEALIIPELAKIYLNQKKTDNTRDLSTYGITIVVVGGISFKHFFQLFSNVTLDGQSKTKACLMIRCSALSDRDPDRYENTATDENSSELKGVARYISNLSKSTHCRLFVNSRTFEFDLAVEGNNLQIMSDVLYRMFSNDCAPRKLIEDMQNKKWDKETKEERENAAKTLVSVIKNRGKGQFALHLFDSDKCNSLSIPPYIKDALKWVLPPDVNHTR